MNRKDYIDKIAKYSARFVEEVRSYNDLSLYDYNIHAENSLIPILNAIFGLELKNINSTEKKNYPAIDLADKKNRVAFQISSTSTLEKIKTTLEKFRNKELFKEFDTLYFFFIIEKDKKYNNSIIQKLLPENYDFSIGEHILDITDLRNRINQIQNLDQLEYISRLFEREFSDVQIEMRRFNYESNLFSNESEKILLNILEVRMPPTIFIADVLIDEVAIGDRINNYLDSVGKRRIKKFKLDTLLNYTLREFEFYNKDWVTREKRIITFRDLNKSNEPLLNIIDKGTIVEIDIEEYYLKSRDNLNIFKDLLKKTFGEFAKTKDLEWLNSKGIYRFRNYRKNPDNKIIDWVGQKKASKTVITKIISKPKTNENREETHIICFRHLAFRVTFEFINDWWYVMINPTYSFTNPFNGRSASRFESSYLKGMFALENNNAVCNQFRFLSFYLTETNHYRNLFDQRHYDLLSFRQLDAIDMVPSFNEEKWKPINTEDTTNIEGTELSLDKELTNDIFD